MPFLIVFLQYIHILKEMSTGAALSKAQLTIALLPSRNILVMSFIMAGEMCY